MDEKSYPVDYVSSQKEKKKTKMMKASRSLSNLEKVMMKKTQGLT